LEIAEKQLKDKAEPFLATFDPSSDELQTPGAASFYTGLPTAGSAKLLTDAVLESHNGSLDPPDTRGPQKVFGGAALLMLVLVVLRLGLTLSLATTMLCAATPISAGTTGKLWRFGLRVWLSFFETHFRVPTSRETRRKIPRSFRRVLGRRKVLEKFSLAAFPPAAFKKSTKQTWKL
jgi:hypothetical protein